MLGQWLTIEQDLTFGRLHQTGQQTQQTGFTAAVGAADLHHIAADEPQFEIFEEQPQITFTREGNGLQDRTGQGITGLIRFKSALARPLKRCSINAMTARSRELRQTIAMFFERSARRAALYMSCLTLKSAISSGCVRV